MVSVSAVTVLGKLLMQAPGTFERWRGNSVEILVGQSIKFPQFLTLNHSRRPGDLLVDQFATSCLRFFGPVGDGGGTDFGVNELRHGDPDEMHNILACSDGSFRKVAFHVGG